MAEQQVEIVQTDGGQRCAEQYILMDTDGAILTGHLVLEQGSCDIIYENDYILQNDVQTNQVDHDPNVDYQNQMEQEITMLQNVSEDAESFEKYAQVTLTDEQMCLLEQNGQLILDVDDKVYLLDSNGLQDITHIDELNKAKPPDETYVESVDIDSVTIPDTEIIEKHSLRKKLYSPVMRKLQKGDKITIGTTASTHKSRHDTKLPRTLQSILGKNTRRNKASLLKNDLINSNVLSPQTIKLDSKCHVKDVPDKIFIGLGPGGKKMYAQVVDIMLKENKIKNLGDYQYKAKKLSEPFKDSSKDTHTNFSNTPVPEIEEAMTEEDKAVNNKDLRELQLHPEMHRMLKEANWKASSDANDIKAAKSIIASFVELSSVLPKLAGKNVLHTRTIHTTECGDETHQTSAVVEGQVVQDEKSNGGWKFIHAPFTFLRGGDHDDYKNIKDSREFVHFHVIKTVKKDMPSECNVIIYQRKLPMKRQKIDSIFACSVCAFVFNSEKHFKDHHKTHESTRKQQGVTMEQEIYVDPLAKNTRPYPFIKKSVKLYSSKSHKLLQYQMIEGLNNDKLKSKSPSHIVELYKCDICPSSYFYASSLTRHIKTEHIALSNKPL